MKRIPLFALLLPSVAFACEDLPSYRVNGLSFQQLAAEQAVTQTLAGTPLVASFTGALPTKLVNANNVSGPLDQVLTALAGQFDMTYAQEGCALNFTTRAARVFSLSQNDMIHDRLGEWLSLNGYSLSWEAAKYRAGAAIALERPLDDVLREVASVMRANGVKISIEIYANRMVRVTENK